MVNKIKNEGIKITNFFICLQNNISADNMENLVNFINSKNPRTNKTRNSSVEKIICIAEEGTDRTLDLFKTTYSHLNLKYPIPIQNQMVGASISEKMKLAGSITNYGSMILFIAASSESLLASILSIKDNLEFIDGGDPEFEEDYHLTENHIRQIEEKKRKNDSLVRTFISCLEKPAQVIVYDATTRELLVDFVNVEIEP